MDRTMLIVGPLLGAAAAWAASLSGLGAAAAWTAAVVVLCAVWWVSEPVPIPATSLIPIALFPLVGVLTPAEVGQAYGNPLVLLFLGGFLLSTAMERSGAHRRTALSMVSLFGASNGRWLVGGFMLAAGVLSMWISNMATTLMLLPIALAVIEQTDDRKLQTALMLGIAYAASIGGIGTPIGTPPNLVFMQVYRSVAGSEPTFLEWMSWSLPVAIVMGPLAMLWLTRNLGKSSPIELPSAGEWRSEELRTLTVFAVTTVLWITRKEPFGGWSGWASLLQANDASVALLAAVAMFLIPNGRGERLLDWETAVRIPWGILILYGGGIAIATAFTSSGLSNAIGESLSSVAGTPVPVLIAMVCMVVTFLTEVTSNTATATLLMPFLAAVAHGAGVDPRVLMVPATLSASFAFMLPVATPPNAVVFGTGCVGMRTMATEGFVLNLIGVAVVTAVCSWTFATF
ncbi:SLC13 family permease [Botrimarina hoheduenensis]|uniref:Sodium-dependent dicarboxylate transporter SdcS n=1 Tax=Botrimarina hoheduenensis TaxID=2528000 RepID=A0A5C5VST3_9BACT|nr:SLC13 family permease [Botrimarina hoheduenensis]TWT41330.1 Sodium-dependent dicarboxylate transporter SdcS [Botrimarina hoheduenensis]